MECFYGPRDREELVEVREYLDACVRHVGDDNPKIHDRTEVALAARSVCSDLLINPRKYGMGYDEMREIIGEYPFLMETELSAIPAIQVPYPMPVIPPRVDLRYIDGDDFFESIIDSGPRHGEAYLASKAIVEALMRGLTVGIVTGKWRILNSGEIYMLSQCIANCQFLVVGVDDDYMCTIRGQDSVAPFTPRLDIRMSQLLGLEFARGRNIDFVYPVRREHPWMYADDSVSPLYVPLLLPTRRGWEREPELTEDEYWQILYAQKEDPTSQKYYEVWRRKLIERGILSRQGKWVDNKPYRRLQLFLSFEPEAAEVISARASIFKLAGGSVTWITTSNYPEVRASSTDIIEQLKLPRDNPIQSQTRVILHPTPEQLAMRARVIDLRERALQGNPVPDTGPVMPDGPF